MEKQISVFKHLYSILKSIDDDLILALKSHERENQGGFLSIPRGVFCYIDYLGSLRSKNGKSSDRAIEYMKKYLTQANSKYNGKCELMYEMWRHGTVHGYDAKIFESKKMKFKIEWSSNNSSKRVNRDMHLECCNKVGEQDSFYWCINLFELVEELKASVIYFINDIELDPTLLRSVRENLKVILEYEELKDSTLLSEAQNIVDHPIGAMDKHGQVLRHFNNSTELERSNQH